MNADPRDDLERAIDETLTSMMNEAPRRVNAASVRQALSPRRRSVLPVWFALAAVLIIGFVVNLRKPRETSETPKLALAPSPTAVPSPEMSPRLESSVPVKQTSTGQPYRASRRAVSEVADDTAGGVPRLLIASLSPPAPLPTPTTIGADTLLIPRIEITPLSVGTLSAEPELNPPTNPETAKQENQG
jgi:hypothetical protein